MGGKQLKLLAFFLLLSGCRAHEVHVLIPDGFTGWVTVEFSGDACQAGNGSSILVSSDGRGCSPLKELPAPFLFSVAYVDPSNHQIRRALRETGWGGGGEIWGPSTVADRKQYRFFVGSEEVFKATYEKPAAPGA